MGFLDELVSLQELADKLGVDESTVRRWTACTELEGHVYQVEPFGRVNIHEPSFEKWYRSKTKSRLNPKRGGPS